MDIVILNPEPTFSTSFLAKRCSGPPVPFQVTISVSYPFSFSKETMIFSKVSRVILVFTIFISFLIKKNIVSQLTCVIFLKTKIKSPADFTAKALIFLSHLAIFLFFFVHFFSTFKYFFSTPAANI